MQSWTKWIFQGTAALTAAYIENMGNNLPVYVAQSTLHTGSSQVFLLKTAPESGLSWDRAGVKPVEWSSGPQSCSRVGGCDTPDLRPTQSHPD